jgi:ERO1-like protein alpha
MICNFHTCTVCQCDENEVPLPWMQDSENDDVDKSIGEKFYQWVEKYNYSSPNWIVENEIDSRNGIYVNLEKNPEAFTGYQGQHIWNAIYFENCFKESINNNFSVEQLCKEEKTFYKIISGLHSNINIHLSKNYVDLQKNVTYFNTSMMNDRLLKYPDRVNNLLFLHSLLLKSFYKAEPIIKNFNFFTGNDIEDKKTKNLIDEIYNNSGNFSEGREICDECLNNELTASENSYSSGFDKFLNFNPYKLDELKMRFRNISQIVDCVSCQKCKLHGKLQIYGLATMMKILFAKEGTSYNNGHTSLTITNNRNGELKNLKLKRNEIISFVNLVGKVSKSVKYFHEGEEKVKLENFLKNSDNVKSNESLKILTIIYSSILLFILLITNKYFLRNPQQLSKKIEVKENKLKVS